MDQFYFQVMLTLFFYVIYSWQVIKSMNPANTIQSSSSEGSTMQDLFRQKRIQNQRIFKFQAVYLIMSLCLTIDMQQIQKLEGLVESRVPSWMFWTQLFI